MQYFSTQHYKIIASWISALALVACGGGGGGGSNSQGNTNPSATNADTGLNDVQAKQVAMELWTNSTLTKHPKGSCAGCHGADFFDLARIGSTDTDIARRATIDGATTQEALALAQAVRAMRRDASLPATNAREFRPLQPGGQVLGAKLTGDERIVAIERDIAFGNQLKPLLPTLFGERIDSLAKAQKARDELLDILNGSNNQGANPNRLNLRTLPTGILYPLWSADLHHGTAEGTFNDWTADIAHDPKPERRAEWLALQKTYLDNPSDENFWRMYHSARDMTQLPLLGSCSGSANACGITDDFNKHKFLSALMGQHLMRLERQGKAALDNFARGPIAFAYLDTDPAYRYMKANNNALHYLPSPLWEVGDNARVLLNSEASPGSFKQNLAGLGYPQFAQDSIDPNRAATVEEDAMRKAWFWIGFTYDPSFSRINGSNATRVGEYMIGTLIENRMFNHNAFSVLMRLVSKGSLPQANVRRQNSTTTLAQLTPKYMMEYSYSVAYNRSALANNMWNESTNRFTVPANLKAQSGEIFSKLMGNGFRMSMYLQMAQDDATGAQALTTDERTRVKEWLNDSINPNNQNIIKGTLHAMYRHFCIHSPSTLTQDVALIDTIRTKFGIADRTWSQPAPACY
jgi:hypothetical protein